MFFWNVGFILDKHNNVEFYLSWASLSSKLELYVHISNEWEKGDKMLVVCGLMNSVELSIYRNIMNYFSLERKLESAHKIFYLQISEYRISQENCSGYISVYFEYCLRWILFTLTGLKSIWYKKESVPLFTSL